MIAGHQDPDSLNPADQLHYRVTQQSHINQYGVIYGLYESVA